jgi:hypothetical protein
MATGDEETEIPVLDSADKVCEASAEAQMVAGIENKRRTRVRRVHVPYLSILNRN